MTGLRWNEEAGLVAGGVLLAAGLVLASALLAPEAPPRMAIPTAGELMELEKYLGPAPADLVEEAGPTETIIIEREPFAGAVAGEEWRGGTAGGPGVGAGQGRRPAGESGSRPRWTLSAVLIAGERRTAILNDQLVRPGERLEDGTRVEVVESDHIVIVTPGGDRRRLELER